MTWQGVSEAECYDNRSVMAQIMRLKDRVRALEEEGSEEIEHEIELINEELTILEGKVAGLEEGAASLTEDVAALETGKADANAVVKLTGNQTIMDVKSFVSSPVVPTPTTSYQAATKKYVDDNDHDYDAGLGITISNDDIIAIDQSYFNGYVKKEGTNQTINSLLIFNVIPHAPGTPTGASDLANKAYVDSVAGGGGGGGSYTAGTGLQLVGTEFSLDSATQTAVSAVSGKADDNAVVKLTGAQSVAGVKTFSDSPVVPTPTTDYQVATKKYVDDNAGGGGTWTTLATTDYNSTMLDTLFAPQGSSLRVTTCEVMIYVYAVLSASAGARMSLYLPKGAALTSSGSISITNVRPNTTAPLVFIEFALNVLFGQVSGSSFFFKSSAADAATTISRVTSTLNKTATIYDENPSTAGSINVCIQYR